MTLRNFLTSKIKISGRILPLSGIVIFSLAIFWMGGGIPGGHGSPGFKFDSGSPLASTADQSAPDAQSDAQSPTSIAASAHKYFRVEDVSVTPGSTVFRTLSNAGLKNNSIAAILETAKPLQNLARIAAGTEIHLAWVKDEIEPTILEFKVSQERTLVVENVENVESVGNKSSSDPVKADWQAHFREAKLSTQTVAFTGVVTSNLWNSAAAAGMDPMLIHRLAEIFAWQIDFNREVQLNDRWRITVEQQFANDEPMGWGNIVAAEYENDGLVYSAVRFAHDGFKNQYFAPDGNSLQRLFLKSPLKFGRITSGFSAQRFHPILKVSKAHLGVDYGAPTGTPIMAVGNGVVTFVGPHGGSGNMIKIRHNATYDTAYKHMSRYATGIRVGDRVEMGEVIGYVGSTGLSTGPHLHFEFYEGGRYVDPQGIKFPAADPVPAEFAADFKAAAQNGLASLPPWSKALLTEERHKSRSAAN